MERPRLEPLRARLKRLGARAGALLVLACSAVAAEDLSRLSLVEAIAALEARGLTIFYSSDLVKPWMIVREAPSSEAPADILAEVIAPYGLVTQPGPDGALLIVRGEAPAAPVDPPSEMPVVAAQARTATALPTIEEIIVNASRYRLRRDGVSTVRSLDQADIARSPDLGDDALRAIARLPGAASSDFSAKSNVRGGNADEMLVRFDDLRLYDPFHLKDFQSVFSSIDPSVVSGVDVYTGGFPVVYGDRMSGVIDIEPFLPDDGWYRELSLSLFNAGGVVGGRSADGKSDWVLSARRGNLDLVLDIVDSSLGDPSYSDTYARYSRQVTDALNVSANLLVFDDDIRLFDSDEEERAEADYRDAYYWLRFDLAPGEHTSASILLGRSDIESFRRGSSEQEGISSGVLSDRRRMTIDHLQADWYVSLNPQMALELGGELRRTRGNFAFTEDVAFDLLFDTPGAWPTDSRSRDIRLRPEGDHYALYGNIRAEFNDAWALQAGLRWDKDTLSPGQQDNLSPRIAIMFRPAARATLRASWGRFYQAQWIHELQVADGITHFAPAQRSDHWVVGFDYRLPGDTRLRIEAYRKDYRALRPRYENLVNTFVLLPELKPDRVRIAPDGALARGAELSVGRIGAGPLEWWASYSWSRVEDAFPDGKVLRSWDQTHALDAGVAWRGEHWDATAAVNFRSGWPTTQITLAQADPVAIAATGPRNGARLGSYRSLDVRVSRRFRFSESNTLTVFFEVHNLLARSNPCCLEYEFEDEDGDVLIDTKVIDNFSVVPSLGIIWRF